VEGFWRAHKVPLSEVIGKPSHLAQLEEWLRSYRPDELFDEAGHLRPELRQLVVRASGCAVAVAGCYFVYGYAWA
jgi:phosphoketolase